MRTKRTVGWVNNYLLIELNDDTFEVLGWRHEEAVARFAPSGEIIELDTEEIDERFAYAMEVFQRWVREA